MKNVIAQRHIACRDIIQIIENVLFFLFALFDLTYSSSLHLKPTHIYPHPAMIAAFFFQFSFLSVFFLPFQIKSDAISKVWPSYGRERCVKGDVCVCGGC